MCKIDHSALIKYIQYFRRYLNIKTSKDLITNIFLVSSNLEPTSFRAKGTQTGSGLVVSNTKGIRSFFPSSLLFYVIFFFFNCFSCFFSFSLLKGFLQYLQYYRLRFFFVLLFFFIFNFILNPLS